MKGSPATPAYRSPARRLRAGVAHVVITVLLFALLAVVTVAVLWVRSAEPDRSGTRALPGLQGVVHVTWDSVGVPHVRANSAEDLLYVQGWLHARDRLFQMDLMRRVAQGRLAEVLGEPGLAADRFLRTLDLWSVTADEERLLSPEAQRLLGAYAAGVNAWIQDHHGALPPEFLALRYEPEPWTVRHSIAVAKVMAQDLSLYGANVAIARAARRLGRERARFLLPAYPDWGATILSGPVPAAVPPLAAELLGRMSIATASNAWAIGPSRTGTGEAILANDPHLGLQAPSIWYLMALHGGGMDVMGVTLPGAPLVILGRNRAIAWGMTNASVDDADLFVERRDPADSTRYLTPDGSRPFQVKVDTIRVKGREQPALLRVLSTRHGPVMNDVETGLGDSLIAVQWTSHRPARTLDAVLALNTAAGWDDFTAAVDLFQDPHQNVVYADSAGHIGYYMGGTVPIRGEGRRPPVLPVPGWTGDWDWKGVLPFERHPHVLDPAEDFVVTANNRQAAGARADLISTIWEPPFRAMRIQEMIRGAGTVDAGDVARMQFDLHDDLAARYRPQAVAAARAAGLEDVAGLLEDWDLRATGDSRAAAIFYLWYDRLRDAVADTLFGDAGGYLTRRQLYPILETHALPGAHADSAAAFAAVEADAMTRAVDLDHRRDWGDVVSVIHAHPLGSVDLLERLLHLNVGPAPYHGSPYTVNVANYGSGVDSDGGFTTTDGPSMRHITDFANPDGGAAFILGTGQSGLPFSDHYRDQFPRWLDGSLWRLPMRQDDVDRRAVSHMTLIPQR